MLLTRQQKQDLLIQYFANEINGDVSNEILNEIFSAAKWSSRAKENKGTILAKDVSALIPGNELYDLIYSIYDMLNDRFNFNQSTRNATLLCCGIESLVVVYHKKEFQQSKDEAFKSTLLFSLLLVTTPFAKSYYESKFQENYRKQNFQELFVDKKYLENNRNSETRKVHGLLSKSVVNKDQDFKSVLFNKKNHVRKFMTSSENGFFNRWGVNLLGSKEQIEHAVEKIHDRGLW
ncbi:MAG: hypothetical protein SFW66_02065 [Gammaproteobacteria bacterium]|nr:hypothetical protein [Gammaproteobacteria bacterium]